MIRFLPVVFVILLFAMLLIAGRYTAVRTSKEHIQPASQESQLGSNQQENHLQPVPVSDSSEWKVYRNEEYRFELKYPSSLEPLTGRALTYSQSHLTTEFTLCLAPINRNEFSCEVELYITQQIERFRNGAGPFLRNEYREVSRERNYQPLVGQHKAQEIDVTSQSGEYIRNTFVQYEGKVYLFVLPNLSAKQPLPTYYTILASVRFLQN